MARMTKKAFNETPEFLALQAKWDDILKEDGFQDIELRRDPTRLNGMSAGDLARGLYSEDAEDYYRWARQHTHEMKPGPRRAVWRMHAEGASVAVIFTAIGERYDLRQGTIDRIVREERSAMESQWAEEFDGDEAEYTISSLIAESVRPQWFTVPAKGPTSGKGLSRRPKKRVRK